MVSPERLQVFISSVMATEDMGAERSATKDAIEALRLTRPWAFEFSPAAADPPERVYLEEVRKSDLLVLIVSKTHSEAVQAELEAAEGANVRILAFVRKIEQGLTQTEERRKAIEWLSSRVKYETFTTADDLAERVSLAIILELVRGYRKYLIGRTDLRALVQRVPSPPSLLVRSARPAEREELAAVLRELIDWYPHIGSWVEKVLAELDPATEVRVADFGGEVAGISIVRDKEPSVRKFSTIYVRPGFRGEAIGPHLVYEEVKRAAEDSVRKAYVTLAHELRGSIGGILERYGFVYEGVSSSRYRPGTGEWVMGKTFSYGVLTASNLRSFIKTEIVEQCGGEVVLADGDRMIVKLPAETLFGILPARDMTIVSSVSPTPEDDYEMWANRLTDSAWLFVSLYGRPADMTHWASTVTNWLDVEDLRSRFYPLRVETPDQASLICTIKPGYADALIPARQQPQLFTPSRLQVRPDNVYYRAPKSFAGLRRGSALLFYVSAPEMKLRGQARIQSLLADTPEECLSKFEAMGVFNFEDLTGIADKNHGKVLAIVFDWYKEYALKRNLDGIREIVPNYNPIAARSIPFDVAQRLDE